MRTFRDIARRHLAALLAALAAAAPLSAETPAVPVETGREALVESPRSDGPSGTPAGEATAPPAGEGQLDGRSPSLLGGEVRRGQFEYRYWTSGQSMDGLSAPAPVLVVSGRKAGPIVCMTGAVHGDELNGVEIIRRVMFGLEPEELNGTVIGIPIVNLHGFRRNSRYLADRRDLNRFFPGDPRGSSAARIAHSLFTEVIRNCDYLVDIHTGSFQRTNLAQIRADLDKPSVLKFARTFGDITLLNHPGAIGTLRRAATDAGIAAATIEVGEPLRLQPDQVAIGVRGIKAMLGGLGISVRGSKKSGKQAVFNQSTWLRTDDGGILMSKVELGDDVTAGQVLGTVTDPITNRRGSIVSPTDGRILGMAINQVVMPGFAAFHLAHRPRGEEPQVLGGEATPPATAAMPESDGAIGGGAARTARPSADMAEPRDEEPETEMEPEDHPE